VKSPGLPFASLNLVRNPFGEPEDDERGALAVVDIDVLRLAKRLSRPGFAVELAGRCGRGKSTHMRTLHAHFPDVPYTLVEEGTVPPIPEAPVVFVDEVQRLPPRVRRRLFRRRASFVLGTHSVHGGELDAAGVTHQRIEVGGLTRDKLMRVVARRVEWARRGPGPVLTPPAELLESLHETHGDDLRAIGDALYDWVQRRRDETDGRLHAHADAR